MRQFITLVVIMMSLILAGCSRDSYDIQGTKWIGEMAASKDSIFFGKDSCYILSIFHDGYNVETNTKYHIAGDTVKIQIPEMIKTTDLLIRKDSLIVLEGGEPNSLFFIKQRQ